MSRLFPALLAAAVLTAGAAQANADAPDFDLIFAEAETVSFDVQIAGTYEARNEVLVKLPNRNQYAVPVPADTDFSKWRTNMLVTVSITQGMVINLSRAEDDAEPFVYETLTSDDIENLPADILARRITYAVPIDSVDVKEGEVTFTSFAGDKRTASVSQDTAEAVKAFGTDNAIGELTYYDSIAITER
ncbi:MAG: hypothetical protein AAF580_10155 [Pseudomonadota bacterium]